MRIFDSKATAERLPFDALIPAIRQMFTDTCIVPRRHSHIINDRELAPDTLLLMPAWQEGRFLGIKHVTIFPENSKKGNLPGLFSTYTLFDATNGQPLSLINGDQITVRRTAAASALAASYLARKDSSTLLIVGAGNVAGALTAAYRAVLPIEKVLVWNINADKAEALAARLSTEGFDARPVTDLRGAVQEADIVSCATLSREPLIKREWLRPGMHLDLIGSFQPTMREADDDTFADTSVFVDTTEALDKSGDLLSPMQNGRFNRDRVLATLEDLCRGVHTGRTSATEITVYKAVGTALEDLAAAVLVYQSA